MPEVFVSYSHSDSEWLDRLDKHFRALWRSGNLPVISQWDDRWIAPGEPWREKISEAIRSAKVAVLLISTDFLASEFIRTVEMPELLTAAESAGLIIVSLYLKPASIKEHPLTKYQFVNSRPVIDMTEADQERAFRSAAKVVFGALEGGTGLSDSLPITSQIALAERKSKGEILQEVLDASTDRGLRSQDILQSKGTVSGQFVMPDEIRRTLSGSERVLLLAIEEERQEAVFSAFDLGETYSTELSEGIYRFRAFLVDGSAEDPVEATIQAIGLPCTVDLLYIEQMAEENPGALNVVVNDSPTPVRSNGHLYTHFLFVESESEFADEYPDSLGALFEGLDEYPDQETANSLSGVWRIAESYEHGETTGTLHLREVANELFGFMIVRDVTNDGDEFVVKETIVGRVEDRFVDLHGVEYEVLDGDVGMGYCLDSWQGKLVSTDVMEGQSRDEMGTRGQFVMTRETQGAAEPLQLSDGSGAVRIGQEEAMNTEGIVLSGSKLGPGESVPLDIELEADTTYAIYVTPAKSRADFDLHVFDENGSVVAIDDDPDSDALCVVTPRWTGKFTVVVSSINRKSKFELLISEMD